MRDAVAALVAAALIFLALSLLTSLHFYRKRQHKARADELARGRTIIVELPTDPELTLVTEDAEHFYYGATAIDKNAIMAVRMLINGSPIAAFVAPRWESDAGPMPLDAARGALSDSRRAKQDQGYAETSFEDTSEGILRDRWDVAIETVTGTMLVECGAVRERVSQELARKVFDAVKADLEKRC